MSLSAALAIALAPAPAAAPGKWQQHSPARSREVLRAFADCAVKLEPALARRFVLMPAEQRMPEAEFRRLFNGRCLGFLGGQLQMRAWASRGALAEALVRRQVSGPAPAALAAAAPLEWRLPAPVPTPLDEAEQLVSRLGECTVRADPAGTLAVLRSKADGPSEVERMKALTPRIAGCVQSGSTLEFNRSNLRTAMAIAYYRLWSAALPSPTSSTKGQSR